METYTTSRGVTFNRVADEPYTRKDGSHTTLQVWHAVCAHPGCLDPVVAKAAVGADPAKAGNFNRIHCEQHKLSPKEATEKWLAACTKTNTKATPVVISRILSLHQEGRTGAEIAEAVGMSRSRVYVIIRKNQIV